MSASEDLAKLRAQLETLHNSKDLDPEQKDQKARKIRRQIRKLAAEAGEPSRVTKSPSEKKPRRLKKGGGAINLDHVIMIKADGSEVHETEADRPTGPMSKEDRRKARRDRRKALKESGRATIKQSIGAPGKPWDHREEMVDLLTNSLGLTQINSKTLTARGGGYGYLVTNWPLEDSTVTAEAIMESHLTSLTQMVSKFKARMGTDPRWYHILKNIPSVIVVLGPVVKK